MRQNPHVRICGGPGSATTLVYPTPRKWRQSSDNSWGMSGALKLSRHVRNVSAAPTAPKLTVR